VDAAVEVHVELRIEPGAISGSMTAPRHTPTAFVGWLGLIDVVERLQADLAEATDAEPKRELGPTDRPHHDRGDEND
jgi:hypothetical protein